MIAKKKTWKQNLGVGISFLEKLQKNYKPHKQVKFDFIKTETFSSSKFLLKRQSTYGNRYQQRLV